MRTPRQVLRAWLGVDDLDARCDALNLAAGKVAQNHEQRLRAYETHVPSIAKIRRAIDEKAKREARSS